VDARELQTIRQRLVEGYYDADAEALSAMRLLLDTVHHLRDDEPTAAAEELTTTPPRT
jgi:hypothetical protein